MSATVTFVDRNYDEALAMMVEARNYIAYGQADRAEMSPDVQLKFSFHTMRVTARLIGVTAWILTEKAVRAGEITRKQSREDEFSLASQNVCVDPSGPEDETLPQALRSLLDRSHRLYMRIVRLDALTRDSA